MTILEINGHDYTRYVADDGYDWSQEVCAADLKGGKIMGQNQISFPFGKHLVASGVVNLTTPKFLGDRLRFELVAKVAFYDISHTPDFSGLWGWGISIRGRVNEISFTLLFSPKKAAERI